MNQYTSVSLRMPLVLSLLVISTIVHASSIFQPVTPETVREGESWRTPLKLNLQQRLNWIPNSLDPNSQLLLDYFYSKHPLQVPHKFSIEVLPSKLNQQYETLISIKNQLEKQGIPYHFNVHGLHFYGVRPNQYRKLQEEMINNLSKPAPQPILFTYCLDLPSCSKVDTFLVTAMSSDRWQVVKGLGDSWEDETGNKHPQYQWFSSSSLLRARAQDQIQVTFLRPCSENEDQATGIEKCRKETPLKAFVPANAQEMMKNEFYYNCYHDGLLPSNVHPNFNAQFFKMPADLIQPLFASEIPDDIKNEISFQESGRTYYRWLINPEDTQYSNQIEEFLKRKGLDSTRYSYGLGFLSASRSCLVQSPSTGNVFYFKGSTNKIRGNDSPQKKLTAREAYRAYLMTQLTQKVKRRIQLKSLITLETPVALFLEPQLIQTGEENLLNQALLFRSLGEFPKNGNQLIPFFSLLTDFKAETIAKLNLKDPHHKDPAKYWQNYLMGSFGKATAELLATHGISMTSAHSQQYLVETSPEWIPTERVAFRDFGDSDIVSEFFRDQDSTEILNIWLGTTEVLPSPKVSIHDQIISFSHQRNYSQDSQVVSEWSDSFHRSFVQRFSELTKIPKDELNKKWTFSTHSPSWQKWLSASECFRGKEKMENSLPCLDVMDCYAGENTYSSRGYLCTDVLSYLREKNASGIMIKGPANCELRNQYYNYRSKDVLEELKKIPGCQ